MMVDGDTGARLVVLGIDPAAGEGEAAGTELEVHIWHEP
jgi:hypothetical protein